MFFGGQSSKVQARRLDFGRPAIAKPKKQYFFRFTISIRMKIKRPQLQSAGTPPGLWTAGRREAKQASFSNYYT